MNKYFWFGLLLSTLNSTALAAPLHDVAREGRVSQVKKLVGEGADANAPDYYGFTPLLLAKLNDHNITAGWLESKGAETGLPALTATVQLYLQYLGLQTGGVDGLLGPGTRDAIRAFQKQQGLPETGRIRETWVKRLHNEAQKEAQQQLKAMKLYPGPVDGLMGPSMRKAIRAFQKKFGLQTNGRMSQELLAQLQAKNQPTTTPKTKVDESAVATTTSSQLSQDSSTPTVDSENPSPRLMRYLQVRLKTLGYDPGDVDGQMGPGTEAAIREFQTKSNLPVTGKISENWIARLNLEVLRKLGYSGAIDVAKQKLAEQALQKKSASEPTSVTKIATTSESEATSVKSIEVIKVNIKPDAFADETISIAQLFRWEGDLDNLSSRFSTRLQSRLKTLAYDPGEIDGTVGPSTVKAIRAFQEKNQLAITGRVSEGWLALLETELIKLTQAKLTELDLDPGPIDGAIGTRTTAAIRSFQKQQELTQTGEPSDFLIAKIDEIMGPRKLAEEAKALAAIEAQKARIEAEKRAQTAAEEERKSSKKAKEIAEDRQIQTIQTTQANLKALGLYSSNVDGKLGPATQKALEKFQRQIKLKADGKLDKRVFERLNSEIVRTVQARLQILGYQPGTVDGSMGKRTREAIRDFQQKNKLNVRGEATATLATQLQQAINSRLTTQPAKPKPAKSPAKTKAAKTKAAKTKKQETKKVETTAKSAPAEKTDSKPELSTRTVAKLQSELDALGYSPGPADGKMGQRTTNAIRQYQSRSGLRANGEPSPQMLAKLSKEAAKATKNQNKTKRSKGKNTEVRGKLRFQRASNGSLLGCSIKGVQLDRVWCDPFAARRNTSDCKAVLRPNSDVLLVKCS